MLFEVFFCLMTDECHLAKSEGFKFKTFRTYEACLQAIRPTHIGTGYPGVHVVSPNRIESEFPNMTGKPTRFYITCREAKDDSVYLLILCSASGCRNDPQEIPHEHRFFQSLEACETHLADPYYEVIFPPDSQGRYHIYETNAAGEKVISDKWWECQRRG